MTSRPRAHQLEELSRRAFAAALPSAWVHRQLVPDYGLDETVEIFDQRESATGLSFHVQLKATDTTDLSKALKSLRFRREQANYYRSLALPVLVALFHSPTDRLFVRWFHAYNPHVAVRSGSTPPGKTISFKLSESDEWCEDTPGELEAGVRAFNAFRSPELPLPIQFTLDKRTVVGEKEFFQLLFDIRAVLKPVENLVVIEAAVPNTGRPFITLSREGTVVSLADVASVTFEHDEDVLENFSRRAADIAVAIAAVLARIGQSNLAAQIGAATAAFSGIVRDFDVAFTLAGAMARSHRAVEALRLSDALDERAYGEEGDEDARFASHIIESIVLAASSRLNDDERSLAIEVGVRKRQRAEDAGNLDAAAATSYNLGMLNKGSQDSESAIAAFQRAAELDPSYLDRAYFHSDLAGAFFETGAFSESAQHYGQALALGSGDADRALLADALLFSGRYAEAEEQFNRYIEGDLGPADAEWRLKQGVLPRIRTTGGDVQKRAPEEADALSGRVDLTGAGEDLSIEEAEELITRALSLDACCAEAWFRRALIGLSDTEKPEAGLEPAIISAVLHRTAVGAWINAVMIARISVQPDELVKDLLRVAYRFNGADFVGELMGAMESSEESSAVIPLLDSVMAETDEAWRRGGFVMRVPGPAGEMTEFLFEHEQ